MKIGNLLGIISLVLFIILLLILGSIFLFFQSIGEKIEKTNNNLVIVEQDGEYEAAFIGEGFLGVALCPIDKNEAVSGGCLADTAQIKDSYLFRTDSEDKQPTNAYKCNFLSTQTGKNYYVVAVECI